MARVKCVMMQKDEDDLLEPWVRYYGYLFGLENLTIFDNGTTSKKLIEDQRRFERGGVRIIRKYDQNEHWLAKGDLFSMIIKAWDQGPEYDFAVPLDCDEFLAIYTDQGISCHREKIHRYLDGLIGRPEVLSLDTTHYNVPGHGGWFWPTRGSKRFFASHNIGTLDHGFHIATARRSSEVYATRLTHLHFHHKPYETLMEHARRKLGMFIDVDDEAARESYAGPNCHLTRHFRVSKAQYTEQFNNHLLFGFPDFALTLEALGLTSWVTSLTPGHQTVSRGGVATVRLPSVASFVFDPEFYLSENIDVAATPSNALEHFLTFGFYEGRSAQPVQGARLPLPWSDQSTVS